MYPMPSRYLDPKVDLAFKRVFGEHAHLLKSFLNALLPLPDNAPIESLEYLTPEQVPEVPGLFKNSIVDVKCRDAQGRTFIVEMQMLWSASFEQRILFSGSQAYVKQLRHAQGYHELQPVYALAITNQVFDHATQHYYHHYQIVNVQNPQRVLQGLEFVFIELPKFKPSDSLHASTAKRMHVKWLRFLSEVGLNDQTLGADLIDDEEIQSALKLVEVAAYTEDDIEAYHIHMDKLRLEPTVLADAKAQGLVQGLAQGLAQGLVQGAAQSETKIINALHASGMSLEQISLATQIGLLKVKEVLQNSCGQAKPS
jgi:predicted transposase/invertase (TIGR01784 family)